MEKKDKRRVIPKAGRDAALEIEIMKIMSRAQTPQSGWDIYQKMLKQVKNPTEGWHLTKLMMGLNVRGYLIRVDSDVDLGYLFSIEKTNALDQ
jgi:hypothetical protein